MRRRGRGRAPACLAAVALQGALLGTTAAAEPGPSPSASASGPAIQVVISSVTPVMLRPGLPLTLSGTVVNDGQVSLDEVHVRTRVERRPVTTRSALAQQLTTADSVGGDVVNDISLGTDLAPHGSVAWSATLPPNAIGQDAGGLSVYLVGVEVRGRPADQGSRSTVARVRLPVPFVPTNARPVPSRLAVLWPLVETPARGPSELYLDDDLAASLRADGRLSVLLSKGSARRRTTLAGRGVGPARVTLPLTWVVDPALLQGVSDLADGYRVAAGRTVHDGAGGAAAKAWLTTARAVLQSAGRSGRLITTPYADPDLEALRRNGLGSDVGVAFVRGEQQVQDVLGLGPTDDVVWPPDGVLSPQTLDLLAGSKVRELVLSGDALPTTERLSYTPSARAVVQSSAGEMPTLLTDPVLDHVLAAADPSLVSAGTGLAPEGVAPTAASLVQRFLAETAVMTAELPSRSRDFVAAPPRRWEPDPQFVGALLSGIADVPWLAVTPLEDMRAGAVNAVAREGLAYPPSAQARELSPGYLTTRGSGVGALRNRLRKLRAILGDNAAAATVPFDLALLRTESSQWRSDPARGQSVRAATAAAIFGDSRRVRIASAGLITLASKRGTLPITLENDLDYPVKVGLRLSTPARARLTAQEGQLRTIEAHRKRTLQVDAKAFTAGVFTVSAQLLTPDGQAYGEPVQLRVRSTGYGAIAVAITVGGLVVLFSAIAVRLSRRALRAHRARRASA